MKLSVQGLDLIKRFEGLRTEAYLDTGGVPTLGYGHIKGVKMGDKCSAIQALQWLDEDCDAAEAEVARVVTVPLEQHEFDALVSFEFNTGGLMLVTRRGVAKPSRLLTFLNANDRNAAAGEFLSWVYDNGRKIAGLVKRREAERSMFLGN